MKYDWFEDNEKITISFYIKKENQNILKVNIEPKIIFVDNLKINLFEEISEHKILYTNHRVDIILLKSNPVKWNCLSSDEAPKFSKYAFDIEIEQLQESQLNAEGMLCDLYKTSDSEIKRAMDKSFLESKCTVLSTDWESVKDKKYEQK